MTTVHIFSELRTKYPLWNDLKTFLTGDDGGKLIVIGDGPRVIIRYDKKISNFNIPYVHAFRSVIWDVVANLPVSVAPFKAIDSQLLTSDVGVNLVQDFVEGVMIHSFLTYDTTNIHIATRTKLGADTRFYSKRNFSELILDAPEYAKLSQVIPLPSAPENIPYTFASLVLQHPEHRIVAPITHARIYVVSIGAVSADGSVVVIDNPATWPAIAAEMAPPQIPVGVLIGDPTQFIAQQAVQLGWIWQGFVFKNTSTLQRWRIRSTIYSTVRDLRGGESDSYSRFLRLRSGGHLSMYVVYYPEEQTLFYELEDKMRDQSRELFKEYNAVHRGPRTARKELKTVGWPLNIHVYTLHKLYVSTLKSIGQELTIDKVIEYMNNIAPLKQRAFLVSPLGGKIKTVFQTEEVNDIAMDII